MNSKTVVYVDTSGLGALLIGQPESVALLKWLDQTLATLVSSNLLETELRRIAVREDLDQSDVTTLIGGVGLTALDRALYRGAGFLPRPYPHALDALHPEAARSAGFDVITPGRDVLRSES